MPRQQPVGLATSGSGDALAGIIAGLATRGAPLAQAAAWGVALHARAGRALAERIGPIGYLASELRGRGATPACSGWRTDAATATAHTSKE